MGASTTAAACLRISDFSYNACYCEENVYLLCKQLSQRNIAAHDASDLFVVFISNANRQVPIWCQKAGSPQEDGMVIWDYHVICIQMKKESEALVWDLDTTLQFPETFAQYMKRAFCPWLDLCPAYQRLYRVVAAPLFLKFFASDRRHMKTADGLWKSPPPPYECILGEDIGVTHNLEDYINMSEECVLSNGSLTKEMLSLERWGVVLREISLQNVVVDVVAIFSHVVLALSRSRLSNVELLYLSRSTHYRGKKREGKVDFVLKHCLFKTGLVLKLGLRKIQSNHQ